MWDAAATALTRTVTPATPRDVSRPPTVPVLSSNSVLNRTQSFITSAVRPPPATPSSLHTTSFTTTTIPLFKKFTTQLLPRMMAINSPATTTTTTAAPAATQTTISPAPSASYPFTLSHNSTLKDYLEANARATAALNSANPHILPLSAKGQNPHTLWIGCSDSRINECTALGCLPGEIFTLRNIANVISPTDLSSQAALQFAIEVLKVKKIIVCGHTDCGGVWASLSNKKAGGVLDHWLSTVRHVRADNLLKLKEIDDINERCKELVQLNLLNSVENIMKNSSFVEYYARGEIEIHALIYDVSTGYLNEVPINTPISNNSHSEVFHLHESNTIDH